MRMYALAHAHARAHAHPNLSQAGRACSFTYTAFATAVSHWGEAIAYELEATQPTVSSRRGR